mmetsp:Transcript_12597/g.26999  ORF Transcript_12597/g.26999 Transcript_12597/m.26999 type:complete len:182 (+) Transcript_12597:316-861(+)
MSWTTRLPVLSLKTASFLEAIGDFFSYSGEPCVLTRTVIQGCRDHGLFCKNKTRLWMSECRVFGHVHTGVNVHDAGSTAVLLDNEIFDCKSNGVLTYGEARLWMRGNAVYRNGHAGVCVSDLNSEAEIVSNKINSNGLQGVYVWDGGRAQIHNNNLTNNQYWSLSVAPDCRDLVQQSGNIE